MFFSKPWLLAYALLAEVGTAFANKKPNKPNILFIFADDLDVRLGSLEYLKSVTNRIQHEGFTFENHYATVALCCPARVALLRGQQAHNTNITSVALPGGGYDKFRASGQDQDYLPHWLKKAGYHTEYIGKLMNAYGYYNYEYTPAGWDHFDGLLDPYTYIYNTPIFSANGARPRYYVGQHQSDVLRAKSVDRLGKLLENSDQPWYLEVAPVAPHQQFNRTGMWPPVPPVRHENLHPGLKAPRSPNFNPVVQHKPSWVGKLPLMDQASIACSDETYLRRAQSLEAINELVDDLLDMLEKKGVIDNTYIIFSSDHGYHVGNHRVPAGKTLPYREDTNVALYIRGPGIPKGTTSLPSTHIDLAPTFLGLTQLDQKEWPIFLDGRDLSPYWEHVSDTAHSPETINIEYWGPGSIEATGLNLTTVDVRNTYKTVRIIGDRYSYLYSHWCTNETELYDTEADPYELRPLNLVANSKLSDRFNGLLLVTKTCSENSCRDPWKTLHPDGGVGNLADALDSEYDAFYASLPRVAFKECLGYQLQSNEEPFFFDPTVEMPFGLEFRNDTATYNLVGASGGVIVPEAGHFGAKYVSLEEMEKTARDLTDAEMNR